MRTCALLLAGLTAGTLLPGQNGDSETPQRLVRLSVVATDAKGEPVTNLQASDIRIREDGKVRTVVFFRYAGVQSLIPALPAGQTVKRPAAPPTVILFDRWNDRMMTAANAWGDVGEALAAMQSVESVYIYFLTNNGDLFPVHPLPATDSDLRAMTQPTPAQLRGELDDAVRKLNGLRPIDLREDPLFRVDVTFRALEALRTQMASIGGRKSLIWMTHGFPLTTRVPGTAVDVTDFTVPIREFSRAAAESQIATYTVGESAQGAGQDVGGLVLQALKMFASLTGGRWYGSNNADPAITSALADGRGNYSVAYYSPYREKDRKEHKIRVDASEKNVRLLTREGYFGDAPETDPDEVEQAAFSSERRSPFDGGEIGLRITFSRDASSSVGHFSIRVNGGDVLLEKRDGKYKGSVGLMLAFYQNGFLKGHSGVKDVDLDLTQEQYDQALKDGISITENAVVAAETDKIRVMVFDPAIRALGSATITVK